MQVWTVLNAGENCRELDQLNLLLKTEERPHAVGHCYRCGTDIEPLVSEQWFVNETFGRTGYPCRSGR